MTSSQTHWSKAIVREEIAGVPYTIYADRPRHLARLLDFANHWPDRPLAIHQGRTLTYADLLGQSAAKAAVLHAAGIAEHDRVLITGFNSLAWVVNFWAAIRIGAVPVLANAWWSAEEVAYALDLTRPIAVLADARAAEKLPAAARVLPWDTSPGPAATPDLPLTASENDEAVIIFTSGTEGRAKAVALAHRSFIASMLMMMHVTRRLPFNPAEPKSEISLHTGPLFHIGGPHALFRGIVTGNTLVFPSGRFDPGEVLKLIEQHDIERWNAVPTMLTRVLDEQVARPRDVATLRSIGMGGAPIHVELLDRVRAVLPSVSARVSIGYGLSENAGQATAASAENARAKPGSSGRPLPLVEIAFKHHEDLPDGEILIRSPTQMLGYVGAASSPIDADGWLHTGDLGRFDEEGLLWITGRCKDIIIRGGENIASAAVERAIANLPEVAEVAVIGTPHPDLGEEVTAFVHLKSPVPSETLRAELAKTLASFAVPSRWYFLDTPLPTNQTGKIDRKALHERARTC